MKCEKITEVEDSYLLGELDRKEMEQVEQHIKDCLDCARRLSGYEEVLGRMFSNLKPVAPAAYNRAVLLQKVSTPAPEKPALIRRERPPYRPRFGFVYGLAAALMLGLTAWALFLFGQLQDSQGQQLEAQKLLDLTSSPDSLVWAMLPPGLPFDPTAPRARMYAKTGSDFYLVTAVNMRPTPDGEIYRIWYVRGPQTELAGSFVPNAGGKASLRVSDQTRSAADITRCFITIEKTDSPASTPNAPPLLEWKRAAIQARTDNNQALAARSL